MFKTQRIQKNWWGNFGRRKKVTNFSRNCSLRTFRYDLSKEKFLKILFFFYELLKKKVE